MKRVTITFGYFGASEHLQSGEETNILISTMRNYYLLVWYIRVASPVKTWDLKKLGKSQNFIEDSLVPSLPAKMKILLIQVKKSCSVVRYFT